MDRPPELPRAWRTSFLRDYGRRGLVAVKSRKNATQRSRQAVDDGAAAAGLVAQVRISRFNVRCMCLKSRMRPSISARLFSASARVCRQWRSHRRTNRHDGLRYSINKGTPAAPAIAAPRSKRQGAVTPPRQRRCAGGVRRASGGGARQLAKHQRQERQRHDDKNRSVRFQRRQRRHPSAADTEH